MTAPYHVPVLLEEALGLLLTDTNGTYVDGTLGGGGHARGLLARLGPRGLLLGVDRDPEALASAAPLAAQFPGRFHLVRGDFGNLGEILAAEGWGRVQGILLDLGVSSRQLDEGARGFSFLRDGPLDMRMDPTAGAPASDLVNTLDEKALAHLFREYGEEPRAGRVARAVTRARTRRPFATTGELARVVEEALGRRGGKHPATRVFQALRIAVNQELASLDRFLGALPSLLKPGGRVVVIAYHSLEDRRVKQVLRSLAPQCRCAPEALRCSCGSPGLLRPLGRKAWKAGMEEVRVNPRARSARLRAAERLPDPPRGGAR
ncbi:MAG: 16S rRNA (cytosine(1402)-N(4))-methyltransferase RsmH [Deferrisomatales bacterium]|nr:16S rRNA (cytosine(1402)-N(4))-methyltransferase RsmH [Deferrisomatales bacterium]